MRPIADVAADLDLSLDDIQPWGPGAAKLAPEVVFGGDASPGRLVLVSAINPTPAGEGKTTMSIGLTQGARRNGVKAVAALREPSLGPVFGAKGGGTGGGRSMLQPSEKINLHFTGDLHAITSAHNLLSALIDNEIYFKGNTNLDHRQLVFRRALDMNDRFLRRTVIGLGGKAMGLPREDGFDITAASEVMAILCLSTSYRDLKRRLGSILIGNTFDGKPVYARDIKAEGAMAALLRDALLPNLVQTTEGAPAIVHGGPFANIAHGCNSILATRVALRRADVVFTEAGFGFDLGAEKFLDIKCRTAGFFPHAVVIVATVRALKYHGGVPVPELDSDNRAAIEAGLGNLEKHVESARGFGLEPVVAVNVRNTDTEAEKAWLLAALAERGIEAGLADVFGQGGAGAQALAERVVARARAAPERPTPRFTYELGDAPEVKIEKVAKAIYGARGVAFTAQARAQLKRAVELGMAEAPVCMAKTHLSLTDDEKRTGRPRDFDVTVREVRVSAGAGFIVALTGELLTMPGLPKVPASVNIDLADDGTIVGVRGLRAAGPTTDRGRAHRTEWRAPSRVGAANRVVPEVVMRRLIRSLLGVSFALSLSAGVAAADEGGKGKDKDKGAEKARSDPKKASAAPAAPAPAKAELKNAKGETVGTATLEATPHGVLITAELTGIPAGAHAFHIHEAGKCEAPDFKTAGGHFNPLGRKHGLRSGEGHHGGDLPNVEVPEGGKLKVQVMAHGVSLDGDKGVIDADGAALVLHAQGDDYASDPAGNAGGRIACGVITR